MVGRKQEIRTLDEVMSRNQGQLVVVYGRRRVGKTYLIRKYFNNKFTFYHTGEANVGMKDQLLGFRDSLKEYGHDCALPTSWREAFHELRKLIEASSEEKKVVFIDEMPWMDTPRSKFLSALECFWNGWGSSRDDLVMIVCGSASTWIVNNILKNRGGLHNRITDQIHLLPFTLTECEELTKEMGLGMSRQEICSLYMIFGGVAYYWGFLRKGESVAQNVDRLFFAENGKLRGEFDSMLSSLFKRDAGCRKMFAALSSKGIGISRDEILRKTGMSDGKVFCQTLDALEKCGFVRRYTAFGKKQRDSLYQLEGGAQIDLLIDRADNVVNVCEMKFASGDYVLKKRESENIDNKVLAFKMVTESPKSVYLTLVTTNGLVDNEYARKFQSVLFLDDLFRS